MPNAKLKAIQVVALNESESPEPPGLGMKKCIANTNSVAKAMRNLRLRGTCTFSGESFVPLTCIVAIVIALF
jgi:hypothetical protein